MALSKAATVAVISFLHGQKINPDNIVRLMNYEYEKLDDVFAWHERNGSITYEKILDSGARVPVWVGRK